MIALKKYNDGGYVFSGLLDSDHLRENAIKEYLRHEAEIVNFINHNEKNKNDVVFYHSVGTLIKRYEPKNPDDLKYIKDRVRFIFDEKQLFSFKVSLLNKKVSKNYLLNELTAILKEY